MEEDSFLGLPKPGWPAGLPRGLESLHPKQGARQGQGSSVKGGDRARNVSAARRYATRCVTCWQLQSTGICKDPELLLQGVPKKKKPVWTEKHESGRKHSKGKIEPRAMVLHKKPSKSQFPFSSSTLLSVLKVHINKLQMIFTGSVYQIKYFHSISEKRSQSIFTA